MSTLTISLYISVLLPINLFAKYIRYCRIFLGFLGNLTLLDIKKVIILPSLLNDSLAAYLILT